MENICEEIHIVFLDIQMKKVNGIDTAKILQERFPAIIIIFISSYFQYISETFTLNAFQFLLKPINETKFKKEFQRALDTYYRNHYKYRILYKTQNILINAHDIMSIETYERHLMVETTKGSYKFIGKIKDELTKLKPYGFIKTHQGCIVNMTHIYD